ncbi:MAG: hypothetical protein ACR2O4_00725 [Hyphomicrobiaceae bacterium]
MKFQRITHVLAIAAALSVSSTAHAACVTKGAEATSNTAESAKWFALETMVQSVSWALWPSYVANGSVPGYKITKQKYNCTNGVFGVTCKGQATFCKVSG